MIKDELPEQMTRIQWLFSPSKYLQWGCMSGIFCFLNGLKRKASLNMAKGMPDDNELYSML